MTGRPLKHWMLHTDLLAQQFDGILHLSQIFPGLGAGAPPPDDITLLAPLDGNLNDLRGHPVSFTRGSDGLYLDLSMQWQIAGSDVPRFALINNAVGYFDEPARTNICQNFNANPDAALTNIVKGGDAAAVLTREEDSVRISDAGLQNICTEGNAIRLTNIAGSTNAFISVTGTVVSGTAHYVQAFVRGIGTVLVGMVNGSVPAATILTTDYQRVINRIIAAPDSTFSLTVAPGGVCNMLLNQAEIGEGETSPIVTAGTSATRAEDRVSWAGANIFSGASASWGLVVTPSFNQGDVARNRGHTYLKPIDDQTSSIAHSLATYVKDNSFISSVYSYDNDSACGVLSGMTREQECVLVGRHNSGTPLRDFGMKRLGVWTWDDSCVYNGSYASDDALWLSPYFKGWTHHYRNLVMWKRDLSRAELEAVYADFAND